MPMAVNVSRQGSFRYKIILKGSVIKRAVKQAGGIFQNNTEIFALEGIKLYSQGENPLPR